MAKLWISNNATTEIVRPLIKTREAVGKKEVTILPTVDNGIDSSTKSNAPNAQNGQHTTLSAEAQYNETVHVKVDNQDYEYVMKGADDEETQDEEDSFNFDAYDTNDIRQVNYYFLCNIRTKYSIRKLI